MRVIGLGSYLSETLDQKYPVTGIAKHDFSSQDDQLIVILRGKSKTPLFLPQRQLMALQLNLKIEILGFLHC